MLEELADRAMEVFRQWSAARRAEYLKKIREFEERRRAAIAKMEVAEETLAALYAD